MQTAIRYQQQDGRSEPVSNGRFGRDVRAVPATGDVPVADARTTMQTDGERERSETMSYEVDPHAVAAAILDRLLAGGTLAPGRAESPGAR